MFKWFNDKYEAVKDWFKRSETIFIARLEAFTGFVVAALAGIDWTTLLTMDLGSAIKDGTYLTIGGILVLKGVISEWARRRNATDL